MPVINTRASFRVMNQSLADVASAINTSVSLPVMYQSLASESSIAINSLLRSYRQRNDGLQQLHEFLAAFLQHFTM